MGLFERNQGDGIPETKLTEDPDSAVKVPPTDKGVASYQNVRYGEVVHKRKH